MNAFTISKLETMLEQQRSKKKELLRERSKLQTQLESLDRQISGLDGGSVSGGTSSSATSSSSSSSATTSSGRPKNEKSLVAVLEDVLDKKANGMSVGDIVDAVQGAGYKSSSPNFRGIVNQTLIKERKKFHSIERGVYAIKK